MTNISKDKIDSSDYNLLYQELIGLISNLNKNTAPIFLNELFTDSEKIMIVKRFAALVLFSDSYSSYRVALTIGISISTAQRLFRQYELGEFESLVGGLTKKQKSKFSSLIQNFILSKASHQAKIRFINQLQSLH